MACRRSPGRTIRSTPCAGRSEMDTKTPRNDLDAYWMPFTANRHFKANPRFFVGAQGMYYKTADGRDVLDGMAGLWCCNAGHGRPKIVEAIRKQAAELDYSPAF